VDQALRERSAERALLFIVKELEASMLLGQAAALCTK
jgi:hypothetical protein